MQRQTTRRGESREKIKIEKNDIIEIEIDDLGINGEGVAHYMGVTVFLRGALPGERVRAQIILVKQTFLVGLVRQIVCPSPDRVTPPCPVFGKCGGCALQHLDYAAQLKFKRMRVTATLKKVGAIDVEAEKTVPSDRAYRYRNKLSVPVRGNPPALGFFAAASHRLVPVEDCLIQFTGNRELLALTREFMRRESLSGYDEQSGTGDVRHLVAREMNGVTTVTVITPHAKLPQIKTFDEMLRAHYGDRYALYLNENNKNSNVIWGERSEFIGGNMAETAIDGLQVEVHPKSFFQVNDDIREGLYRDVRSAVLGEKVLDAYSGAGLLSALLARGGAEVIAVEREPAAVQSARALLTKNRIAGVRLVTGDCAREIPRLAPTLSGQAWTAVLDPPRAGCDKEVLRAVAAAGAARIVYVSCNPATLARDARLLLDDGYTISRVQPYDMFPNTPEVETLAVFDRRNA